MYRQRPIPLFDFEFSRLRRADIGVLAQIMLVKVQEIVAAEAGLVTC